MITTKDGDYYICLDLKEKATKGYKSLFKKEYVFSCIYRSLTSAFKTALKDFKEQVTKVLPELEDTCIDTLLEKMKHYDPTGFRDSISGNYKLHRESYYQLIRGKEAFSFDELMENIMEGD